MHPVPSATFIAGRQALNLTVVGLYERRKHTDEGDTPGVRIKNADDEVTATRTSA